MRGDACGGGAGVQQNSGAALGQQLGGGGRDGVLVLGPGGFAFAHAGLDEVERAHRNRAAVHSPQHPGLVQGGEIAPDRLGGDVVGLRQFGDRGAAVGDHQ